MGGMTPAQRNWLMPKTHRLNDFEQRCLHAIQKLLRSQRIIIVYDERSRAHHILNVPDK